MTGQNLAQRIYGVGKGKTSILLSEIGSKLAFGAPEAYAALVENAYKLTLDQIEELYSDNACTLAGNAPEAYVVLVNKASTLTPDQIKELYSQNARNLARNKPDAYIVLVNTVPMPAPDQIKELCSNNACILARKAPEAYMMLVEVASLLIPEKLDNLLSTYGTKDKLSHFDLIEFKNDLKGLLIKSGMDGTLLNHYRSLNKSEATKLAMTYNNMIGVGNNKQLVDAIDRLLVGGYAQVLKNELKKSGLPAELSEMEEDGRMKCSLELLNKLQDMSTSPPDKKLWVHTVNFGKNEQNRADLRLITTELGRLAPQGQQKGLQVNKLTNSMNSASLVGHVK